MRKDRPLAEIEVTTRDVYGFTPIEPDRRYYPFAVRRSFDHIGFRSFIEDRTTPPSRQGLAESLEAHGLSHYCIADLLRVSNGRNCSDPFWIRFKDGPQTWKEVWEAVGVYNKE